MKKIVVIGGGASGLISAIFASKRYNEVMLIEKNNICGKKILATGNGRCNYWNEDQNISHYRTSSNVKFDSIFSNKNIQKIQDFFSTIGIIPRIKNGYYYPFSNQAVSIQSALVAEALECNVKIHNNKEVIRVKKIYDKFMIVLQDNSIIYADKVILSTGSKASPKTGSDGIGYKICEDFNHTIIKVLPSLVQLRAKGAFLKLWEGIRADCKVMLYEDNNFIKEESGEIQLTNYGVSGICIFNLSGIIARGLDNNKKEEVCINFLNGLNIKDEQEFIKWMNNRSKHLKNRNILQILEGIINYKLAGVLIKYANLNIDDVWNNLEIEKKLELAKSVIAFKLNIIGTNSFDKAQVCSGGVSLEEIDIYSMQSKKIKNLYITGELLDIDGDCGGYNLELAWITGMIAGENV